MIDRKPKTMNFLLEILNGNIGRKLRELSIYFDSLFLALQIILKNIFIFKWSWRFDISFSDFGLNVK